MNASQHSATTPRAEEKPEIQQHPESPRSAHGKENKKTSGTMAGVPGVFLAIICLILEAIIFVLCVVGTPIDCFRYKTEFSSGVRPCYSMWGLKQCGNHKVNPGGASNKGFPTSGIRATMDAAAAFSIISIFMTLVSLVLTVLLVCKCIFRVIPGIFSIIAFITILIVWACQAGAYHRKVTIDGVTFKLSVLCNYAGSFGLFVTAWCLQTIEMVLVFFA